MTAARAARRGMTLVEILVAILIFSVVGLAMMAILLAGTDLFRQGEYGRSTTDAAVVALAALEDDLDRIVPEADGGLVRAKVIDASGDCVLAFKIERKDPLKVDAKGYGGRRVVAWRGRYDALTKKDVLERIEVPSWDSVDPTSPLADAQLDDPIPYPDPTDPVQAAKWLPVTEGCLHFGVWLDGAKGSPRARGSSGPDWSTDVDTNPLPPLRTPAIEYDAPNATDPFPGSVRIVLALTGGGRFAPTGSLIDDATTTVRIAGVKGVSTLPGSMLRIGDEWVAYNGYSGGMLSCNGPFAQRGALRSVSSAHNRGDPVRLAQFYTIVRPLAR